MQQLEMFAAGSGAFDNLESFESEQKRDALNTQPSWLGVCVCTFSKEVKPVLVYVWFPDDLVGEAIGLFYFQPHSSIKYFTTRLFGRGHLGCLQLHCSTRYFSRGTELFDATLSNEAMHQRGKQDLASLVYLQILVGLKLLIKLLYCVVLHKKWNIFFHNFGA